jgi:hypothetical protein
VSEVPLHTRLVLERWYDTRSVRLAVALDTSELGEVLVTHGGLTVGLWRQLGSPATAGETAARLNALLDDPPVAFKPGWLMTGVYDQASGVTCPRVGPELADPWLELGDMPFNQVHGHESVWDWERGDWHRDVSDRVRCAAFVERSRRWCWVEVGDHRLWCVDWHLGEGPALTLAWEPLVLEGAVHE